MIGASISLKGHDKSTTIDGKDKQHKFSVWPSIKNQLVASNRSKPFSFSVAALLAWSAFFSTGNGSSISIDTFNCLSFTKTSSGSNMYSEAFKSPRARNNESKAWRIDWQNVTILGISMRLSSERFKSFPWREVGRVLNYSQFFQLTMFETFREHTTFQAFSKLSLDKITIWPGVCMNFLSQGQLQKRNPQGKTR